MVKNPRSILPLMAICVFACLPGFAQGNFAVARWAGAAPAYRTGGAGSHAYSGYYHGSPFSYGGGGWYGDFYPAFGGVYGASTSPLDVPPPYWWVSPYPSENPCQAGCNPNAGYEWDSVGTLILDTNPPKAQVSLDGIYAGTTDKLGPFQLPVGEYTLHVQYPGYEASDVIVKFDRPGVQSLNVVLKRLTAYAQPAP